MSSPFDCFESYPELKDIVSAAKTAEMILPISSDSAVTQCRKALELAVKWMYKVDSDLELPYDDSLFCLMSNETFTNICDRTILSRMDVVRKLGNQATHANNAISKSQADICIEDLFYIIDFITYCYFDNYEHQEYSKHLLPLVVHDQEKTNNAKRSNDNAKAVVSTYPAEPVELTPERVNAIYGSKVCAPEMTKSQLEVLLSYLDEGDLSLTDEQKDCVNFTDKSDLLIKGTAGSGKSIVLMQRAIQLRRVSIKSKTDNSVLIVTYANSLVSNLRILISSALQKDTRIAVSTLDHIANSMYYRASGPFRTIDYDKTHTPVEYIDLARQRFAEKHPNKRAASMKPAFLYEEFQWIKGSDITSIDAYIKSGRAGRGSSTRLRDTDYEDVFKIYRIYNTLIHNDGFVERLDVFAALVHEDTLGSINNLYDYVLVDEAQDLPPVVLKFAKRLARKSITIAADSAQKIYSGSFSLRNLGIEIRGRASKSLSSSFRNTKQISEFASYLYKKIKQSDANDQDQFTDPSISTRPGNTPSILQFGSYEEQANRLCSLIRDALQTEGTTIGVLVRSYEDGRVIGDWLREGAIDYGRISGGKDNSGFKKQVRLCTMHSAKGLEFDTVIIPLFQKDIIPPASSFDGFDSAEYENIINQERKLLYVSITRPKNSLFLLYTGKPSPFLSELDQNHNNAIDNTGSNISSIIKPEEVLAPEGAAAFPSSNTLDSIKEGTRVCHKAFGKGVVTGITGNILEVDFPSCPKSFVFPDAFIQGFLNVDK